MLAFACSDFVYVFQYKNLKHKLIYYRITVAEGTAIGSVITVTASDADDPGTNDYGNVAYFIIG